MMKNNVLIFAFILAFAGCSKVSEPKKIYFFETEKRAILLPVTIQDTLCGTFLFDTGVSQDCVVLDSAFQANHPLPIWDRSPDAEYFTPHTAWDTPSSPKYRQTLYHTPIPIAISGVNLTYNHLWVRNQPYNSTERVQGSIGFPKEDSTHIWEINFEHNYLEIHQAAHFERPNNCYWLPFAAKDETSASAVHINFPMSIKSADGDTVTIHYTYLIDTGLALDFVLLPSAKEIDFFRKRDDAILTHRGFQGYHSRYDVSATLFENFEIDSMRIYTDEFADELKSREYGLLGLNFLKRFNVFFDFNSRQIGLQPLKNFQRISNHFSRFYFSTTTTPDGRQFVAAIPEKGKDNFYKIAGLQEGDEIVTINGFAIKDITDENWSEIQRNFTKELEVIRKGKPLKLSVYIDENKLKGD